MPFKMVKVGKKTMGEGPSGRKFTKKQMALYYAHGCKFPGQKKKR